MIVAFTGHRPPKGGLTYSHVSERDREVVAQGVPVINLLEKVNED